MEPSADIGIPDSPELQATQDEQEAKLLETYPQLHQLKTRPEVATFTISQETRDSSITVEISSKDGYRFNYSLRKPREGDPDFIYKYNRAGRPFLVVEHCAVTSSSGQDAYDLVQEKLTPREILWILPPYPDQSELPPQLRDVSYSLETDSDTTYIRDFFVHQRSRAAPIFGANNQPVEMTLEAPLAVSFLDLATVCHETGHLYDPSLVDRTVASKEGYADHYKLQLMREIHNRIGMSQFFDHHINKLHKLTAASYFYKHIGTEEAQPDELIFSEMHLKHDTTPFIDLDTVRRWKSEVDAIIAQQSQA